MLAAGSERICLRRGAVQRSCRCTHRRGCCTRSWRVWDEHGNEPLRACVHLCSLAEIASIRLTDAMRRRALRSDLRSTPLSVGPLADGWKGEPRVRAAQRRLHPALRHTPVAPSASSQWAMQQSAEQPNSSQNPPSDLDGFFLPAPIKIFPVVAPAVRSAGHTAPPRSRPVSCNKRALPCSVVQRAASECSDRRAERMSTAAS